MVQDSRKLKDLVSVGLATLKDFEALGIQSIEELKNCTARDLYEDLCTLTKTKHDPCVEDVFAAAIAQARDPHLPEEKRQWYYYSRLRKGKSNG